MKKVCGNCHYFTDYGLRGRGHCEQIMATFEVSIAPSTINEIRDFNSSCINNKIQGIVFTPKAVVKNTSKEPQTEGQ